MVIKDILEKKRSVYFLLALLALLSVGYFLFQSFILYSCGYPLDDAWIHQAYARNLAENGEWAFISGTPSSGSTAPLWTILLAPGYLFFDFHLVWSLALGVICLIVSGLFVYKLFEHQFSSQKGAAVFAAVIIVLEWHFIWAALSGMETILYVLILAILLYLLFRGSQTRWLICGALIGLAVWVRPDAVTLLGPGLWMAWFTNTESKQRIKSALKVLGVFALFFALYLLFNYLVSGSFWPNTFYAKQAEYAVLLEQPFLKRLIKLYKLPLVGVGGLLLPGFIYMIWLGFVKKKFFYQAWFLWWFGFNLIYAIRLPVTYQHGRYQIPSIFIFIISGLLGSIELGKVINKNSLPGRLVRQALVISLLVVSILFIGLGGRQYARDVAIIESEMVKTALWINDNIEKDSLIAVHDIGAIGYFTKLEILDLAGLVSPEVIPFIRDETLLETYMDEKGIDYLVTFPGWYPELVKKGELIYETGSVFSLEDGGENMQVLEWKSNP